MKLPSSVQHLHGSLYLVPFSLIELAEPEDNKTSYQFQNPRSITEQGQSDLSCGLLASELRDDIKNKGLMSPLICRRMPKDKIQLVGGDRRYRALSFLIRDQTMVVDTSSVVENKDGTLDYGWRLANYVYENVLCQIYFADSDFDALAFSYSENNCRVNFNDGHEIAMLLQLRSYKADDDKIMHVLQKGYDWLQDMDQLVASLDDKTLHELCEGKISLDAAKKLCSIDVKLRPKVMEKASTIIKVKNAKKERINGKRIQKAVKEKDIADLEMQMAIANDDTNEVSQAESHIKKANVMFADAVVKQTDGGHVITGRDIDSIIGTSAIKKKRVLSESKIKSEYKDYLTKVENGDKSIGIPKKLTGDDAIGLLIAVIQGILDCRVDCSNVIKEFFKK